MPRPPCTCTCVPSHHHTHPRIHASTPGIPPSQPRYQPRDFWLRKSRLAAGLPWPNGGMFAFPEGWATLRNAADRWREGVSNDGSRAALNAICGGASRKQPSKQKVGTSGSQYPYGGHIPKTGRSARVPSNPYCTLLLAGVRSTAHRAVMHYNVYCPSIVLEYFARRLLGEAASS